jgi:hypothetical protein
MLKKKLIIFIIVCMTFLSNLPVLESGSWIECGPSTECNVITIGPGYICYNPNGGGTDDWTWDTSAESSETSCSDTFDNDCDGDVDGADSNCPSGPDCGQCDADECESACGGPCSFGGSDCDTDSDCSGSLICGQNIGSDFPPCSSGDDVCVECTQNSDCTSPEVCCLTDGGCDGNSKYTCYTSVVCDDDGTCEGGEDINNCPEDCCESDCTSSWGGSPKSACDGYNGCDYCDYSCIASCNDDNGPPCCFDRITHSQPCETGICCEETSIPCDISCTDVRSSDDPVGTGQTFTCYVEVTWTQQWCTACSFNGIACSHDDWIGSEGSFDCTAPSTPGTYTLRGSVYDQTGAPGCANCDAIFPTSQTTTVCVGDELGGEVTCDDGYDNDCDGDTDGADSECCTDMGLGTPIVNPSSPSSGQAFTIECPVNQQKGCVYPTFANDWSDACTFSGWSGNNAVFDCSGMPPNTYTARCNIASGTADDCCGDTSTRSYTVSLPDCNSGNICDEYTGKYCNGNSWVDGSSHNFGCGTCRTCGGTSALNEGDLSCNDVITGNDGPNCYGLCEYCSSGSCVARSAQTDPENECSGNCNSCNGARACQNYNSLCTGNCDVCSGGNCAANSNLCTGNCDYCNQINPTRFNCAGDNTLCSNNDASCYCSGSGTSFNCQSCNDCYDCASYSCNPTSEDDDGSCNSDCDHCSSGSCVVRSGGDDVEVTQTCYWCDGSNIDPQPHSYGNGINCLGSCTHCSNGNCIDWGPDECTNPSCEGVPCDTDCYDCLDADGIPDSNPDATCQAVSESEDGSCVDPDSCVAGSCCVDWNDNLFCDECTPSNDIICHSNYPSGTYDASCSFPHWSHDICLGNDVCRVEFCDSTDADITSHTMPTGTYALTDTISIPYTTRNTGELTWTFLDESDITKTDSSHAFPANWDTLDPGNSVSDSLTYTIQCSDPLGDWSSLLYTYTDQSSEGGWGVWGPDSSNFEVVQCLDNADCQSCLGPTQECKAVNTTCGFPCAGIISVSNDVIDCGNVQFTVTINNTGVDDLTVDVYDELWEDTNCDGKKDVKIDEASWTDVQVIGLTHTTRQWSTVEAADPYRCYNHTLYFCSKPFDIGLNRCGKNTASCMSEAETGNMDIYEGYAFQCTAGVGVCGDSVVNIGETCDSGSPTRWGACEPYEKCGEVGWSQGSGDLVDECQCYDFRPIECADCWYYDYCTEGMDPLTGESCCNSTLNYNLKEPCCFDEISGIPVLNCTIVGNKLNPDANATPYYCYSEDCDMTGPCVNLDYRVHEILQSC